MSESTAKAPRYLVLLAATVILSGGLVWAMTADRLNLFLFGASFVLTLGVALILIYLRRFPRQARWLVPLTIAALVAVLIFSKLDITLPRLHQSIKGEWIGLSYLIFRLIHLLVDRHKLPTTNPAAVVSYALYPPALVAGPIHRADHFLPQVIQRARGADLVYALWRIGLGVTKKIFLSGVFASFALAPDVLLRPEISPLTLWLMLAAYAFMLYFDFAGYSDLVIGVSALVGIKLPENFANPYAQPTIARFWQSWHMSLSSWLRDYLFFPISRTLLKLLSSRWSVAIMAVAHLTTMLVAGLWHDLAPGYALWGLWHGAGLFIYAQWNRFARPRGLTLPTYVSVAVTFVFVLVGWVFFALPEGTSSLTVLRRLFLG